MTRSSVGPATPAGFRADDLLVQFERLIGSGLLDEASRVLVRLLQDLRRGATFSSANKSEGVRIGIYTRLATAINALFANPEFQVSDQDFDLIAVEHSVVSSIFAASEFGNSDHLVQLLGTRDPVDHSRMNFSNPGSLAKLLLCYSLDSDLELDFEAFARQIPRYAFPAFLGMLSEGMVLSRAADKRREQLLLLGPLFEHIDLAEHMLLMLSAAYMMSSYATSDNKHAIKRSFNRIVRRFIESRVRLPEMPKTRLIKQRPTILVPVEWFNSTHAMFRCYAPSIQQLRQRFRLVMIGHEMCMDDISKALFDETYALPNVHVPIAEVIALVRRINPDVIFYPSLGMMSECVALSSVRLAPIQAATLGHPATTQSDAMDYMLVDGLWPGDPGRFSETVVVQRPGSTVFTSYPDTDVPAPQIRAVPALLRIAVPSSVMKLNANFLSTCRAIAQRASRAVEFHFFPHVRDLALLCAKRGIQKWIPGAVVHPLCDYSEYLRRLSVCDVHLSSFPFGGTNSNIDSMRLALPMVSLLGPEPPAQIDTAMMRRAGLPEWLMTSDSQEYEQAALRLIGNDAERTSIAYQLEQTDIVGLFTRADPQVPIDDFLRAMEFLYEHHESIQATGRRYWSPSDRDEFLAQRGGRSALQRST